MSTAHGTSTEKFCRYLPSSKLFNKSYAILKYPLDLDNLKIVDSNIDISPDKIMLSTHEIKINFRKILPCQNHFNILARSEKIAKLIIHNLENGFYSTN